MYPWFSFAPRIKFPLSGDVAQDYKPATDWFFGAIKPDAGNARIEEKAFGVASYGKQLGLITDILVDLVEQVLPESQQSEKLLALKSIQSRIEEIKVSERDAEVNEIEAKVLAIRDRGGPDSAKLFDRLRAILGDSAT